MSKGGIYHRTGHCGYNYSGFSALTDRSYFMLISKTPSLGGSNFGGGPSFPFNKSMTLDQSYAFQASCHSNIGNNQRQPSSS